MARKSYNLAFPNDNKTGVTVFLLYEENMYEIGMFKMIPMPIILRAFENMNKKLFFELIMSTPYGIT